jgi:hypothetical protein
VRAARNVLIVGNPYGAAPSRALWLYMGAGPAEAPSPLPRSATFGHRPKLGSLLSGEIVKKVKGGDPQKLVKNRQNPIFFFAANH